MTTSSPVSNATASAVAVAAVAAAAPASTWYYVDLFSGMGSFHYSLSRQTGFSCVAASDICEPARRVYGANHGLKPFGDICDIDPAELPPFDIVCAGFPCQPFSQAGHRRGFDDSREGRGTMFAQVMRVALGGKRKPSVIVLENVRGLLRHDGGQSFATVCGQLAEAGYAVVHKVLTCSNYGLPQMRKRLFIVAYLPGAVKPGEDMASFFDLAAYEARTTLTDFLNKGVFAKPTAYTIRCGGRRSPIDDRHNWDGYWVDGREYRLTIADALKLQGFEGYDITAGGTTSKAQQWKLLGNTIPTVFTRIIGERITALLRPVEQNCGGGAGLL